MSALTGSDREGLYANELALDNLHAAWARDTFESAIEAIVARHVAEALDKERARLVKAIEECDPSDDYHRRDVRPGYYSGLDRAIRFIRGDITTWMDPKP